MDSGFSVSVRSDHSGVHAQSGSRCGGYHLTCTALSDWVSDGWTEIKHYCDHHDYCYSCFGDVLPESKTDGTQDQIANVLHLYRTNSVATLPGDAGD